MEQTGVAIYKSPNSNSSLIQCSPGNNPFDDLLKKTIDAVSMSDQVNRRLSLRFTGFLETGRQSLSFHDLNSSDVGRESIGILPPDFGRDSLGFMHISGSENRRESLGILQINALRDSLSFRRESLGLLNLTDIGRESLNCGRESLGILHIKSPDTKFADEDKRIPEILFTAIEESSDYTCDPLNTAFLYPSSRKCSIVSSTTSSITPSFNSCSLEGPSKIYPFSSFKDLENSKMGIMNKKFCNTNELNNLTDMDSLAVSSIHSPLNKARIFHSNDLLDLRSRIQSLPVTLEHHFEALSNAVKNTATRKFWSTERSAKTKILERSFHGKLDFNEDSSNDFYDSVFIEGHHFAEKIADGSILNDSSGSEIGILDCTPQPNWPDDNSYNEKEKEGIKYDSETIFKTVDKMLPPPQQDTINVKLKVSKADCNLSDHNNVEKSNVNNSKLSQINDKNDSNLIHNISDIAHESGKHSTNQKSYSKSKDAKEILQNLSEILNCTNRSDQQKSEGQNLLCSLADILCENKSLMKVATPDDSGHSSSINEQSDSPKKDTHECYEVLDLRTKSGSEEISQDNTTNTALDLSLKAKQHPDSIKDRRSTQSTSSRNVKSVSFNSPKRRNASLSSLDINKNKSGSINSSVNSNDSKHSGNASKLLIAGKLKVKSANSGVKKGPLKAVIPVGDMKKRSSLPVTPERTEQKVPTVMQSKRTSTPINEPKLKPMAASTPTPHSIKDKKDIAKSPIKKPDISSRVGKDRNKLSTSSLPRSLNVESKLIRRNSVTEIKKMESFNRKRSHSIESESGVMSSLAKVRQNIINSPYYQLKKQNSLRENNSFTNTIEHSTKSDRKGLPTGKQINSISKLKKPGKENVRK